MSSSDDEGNLSEMEKLVISLEKFTQLVCDSFKSTEPCKEPGIFVNRTSYFRNRFPLQSLEIHRDLISVILLVMKILALLTGKISSQLSIVSAAIQSFVKRPNDVPIVNQVVEIDLSRLDKNCGAESVCSSLFFHFAWIYERDDYVNHGQGFVFTTKDGSSGLVIFLVRSTGIFSG